MPSIFQKYARIPDLHDEHSRGHPRGLVIADVDKEGNMTLGYSHCSKKDVFSRQMAHKIARGRFESGYYTANIFDQKSVENLILNLPESATILDDVILDAADFFTYRFHEDHTPREIYTAD